MIGKIAGVIIVISVMFGVATGRGAALGEAALDGAASAISLTIALVGMMCLWCGLMEVLREAGVIRRLSRLLAPLLRLFFPIAFSTGVLAGENAAWSALGD